MSAPYGIHAVAYGMGLDAYREGLDRDTLDVDREGIRAVRDTAHTERVADAYTATDAAIRDAWLRAYDDAAAVVADARESYPDMTPGEGLDWARDVLWIDDLEDTPLGRATARVLHSIHGTRPCRIERTSLGGGVICAECGADCDCVVCVAH